MPRIEQYTSLLKARAIENQCFMIGVNRTGKDLNNIYDGKSSVYDPTGKEIFRASDDECIIETEIDLNLVNQVRTALPFLNDIKLI